jgi:hypothetical protein
MTSDILDNLKEEVNILLENNKIKKEACDIEVIENEIVISLLTPEAKALENEIISLMSSFEEEVIINKGFSKGE